MPVSLQEGERVSGLERQVREATGGAITGEAKSRSLLEEVRGGENNRLRGNERRRVRGVSL